MGMPFGDAALDAAGVVGARVWSLERGMPSLEASASPTGSGTGSGTKKGSSLWTEPLHGGAAEAGADLEALDGGGY